MERRSLFVLVAVMAVLAANVILLARRGRASPPAQTPAPVVLAPLVTPRPDERAARPVEPHPQKPALRAAVAPPATPGPAGLGFEVAAPKTRSPLATGKGLRAAVGALAKTPARKGARGQDMLAWRPRLLDAPEKKKPDAYANWLGAAAVR
jgi:hypothetical protein